MSNQPVVLNNWLVNTRGRIIGETVEEVKDTSPVVERDGDVVTTRSGSRYRLGEPHDSILEPLVRAVYFGEGADSPFDCIDVCLEKVNDQTKV